MQGDFVKWYVDLDGFRTPHLSGGKTDARDTTEADGMRVGVRRVKLCLRICL